MELIFTAKQKKLKRNILNNVQIDVLYKLVIKYLDLKSKDANKVKNNYLISQFDLLIPLLDIVDENLEKNIYFNDYFNEKKYNLKLPKNFKQMKQEIKSSSYYESILKEWIFLFVLTFDDEIQNEVFLQVYDAFEEHYNEVHSKNDVHNNEFVFTEYSNLQQKVNRKFGNKNLDNILNKHNSNSLVSI